MSMFQKHYESAARQVKVPDGLIDDTIARLRMERRFHTDTHHKWLGRMATICASLTLIVAAALLIPAVQGLLNNAAAGQDAESSTALAVMGADPSVAPTEDSESYAEAIVPWVNGGADGPDSVGMDASRSATCYTGDLRPVEEINKYGFRDQVKIDGGSLIFTPVSRSVYSLSGYDLPDGDLNLMAMDPFCDYLGMDPLPDVPEDLSPERTREAMYAYAYQDQDGETLGAQMTLSYRSNRTTEIQFPRYLCIQMGKGGTLQDQGLSGSVEASVINGEPVWIGYTELEYSPLHDRYGLEDFYVYYAEFTHNGVDYQLEAHTIEQWEFVSIIKSILAK